MNKYDNMAVEDIAADLTRDMPIGTKRAEARNGIRLLLGPIDGAAGTTWQQKWVATNSDERVRAVLLGDFVHTTKAKRKRSSFQRGARLLIEAEVIRPGLSVTLPVRTARSLLDAVTAKHGADIEAVVAQASAHEQLTEFAAQRMRYACAAMILFTNKRLIDIYPHEWASAETYRLELLHRREDVRAGKVADLSPAEEAVQSREVIRLARAYGTCATSGIITPDPHPGVGKAAVPPTLTRAKREPRTLDHLLSREGKNLPPRVRSLLFDTYSIDDAFDMSTLKRHVTTVTTFMTFVHRDLPDHDSLSIPVEIQDRLLRDIRTTPSGRFGSMPRFDVAGFLGTLRNVYAQADWVVRRYNLEHHYDTLGVFPWSSETIRQIARKERGVRAAKLTRSVLTQVHHLDGIVAAADDLLVLADELRAKAHQAEPNEEFEVRGTLYRRVSGKPYLASGGTHRVRVSIEGGYPALDVDQNALRASHIRMLVTVLRETGVRAEEASDLRMDDFIDISDGDLPVPALNIQPAKQDRGRIVNLHPAVIAAAADLRLRTEALFGHYPLSSRLDWHEGIDLPAQELLFFTYSNGAFCGVSRECLKDWLNKAVEHYDANFNKGIPVGFVPLHQMRRMFATDLGDRGVEPIALQHALGHSNLATVSTYLKVDPKNAITQVVTARRNKGTLGNPGAPA